jgi:hypothetical protein
MKRRGTVVAIAAALAVCLAIPIVAGAGTGITAHATGDQIVNPAGGDPNGSATFNLKVNRVKQRICYKVTFRGIKDVTASHLHKGGPGQIARPIVTFFQGHKLNSPQSGCVHNVKKQIVKRLKRKPSAHYVDIDSTEHPNGAVRGQLER